MTNENIKTYPLMVLRDMVVFPMMVVHLDVGREISKNSLSAATDKDNMIFLAAQKNFADDFDEDDIYSFGTIARVKQKVELPGGTIRILVEGISRAEMLSSEMSGNHLTAQVREFDCLYDKSDIEIKAMSSRCRDMFMEYINISGAVSPETVLGMAGIDDDGQRADVMAFNLAIPVSGKQSILEALDVKDRLLQLMYLLTEETELAKIGQKIDRKVKESLDKHQQEYYLREQLKATEEELEELCGENEETAEYVRKMKELSLPQEVKAKLEHEISRLKKLPPATGETGVIQTYIETVLNLPWGKSDKTKIDILKAKKILEKDHYGLEKVKERVLEYLSVMKLTSKPQGSIMCLYGPPGTGKTSVVKSIAESLGRKYVRVSLGGVRDEADIRGHRKTYIGSMPGRIIEALQRAGSDNPVILLDEIDKMSADARGNPSAALLEVLDSEQNHAFRDHYIELPFDLSKVMFVTTANSLDTIDRPLLDRMDVINLTGYHYEEKFNIAKKHLLPKQLKKHGLTGRQLSVSAAALKNIIDLYTRESGVRNLERELSKICRKTAGEIVSGSVKSVKVTPSNLPKYLGAPVYPEAKKTNPEPGIATGLAWTSVGGETLTIEVNITDGKGDVKLTGNLGDVMKESAGAAISYIRSRAEMLGIDGDFYKTKDIHIHVPEGATPKDGPSAGITMASALISALKNKPLREDIAMTGEITIRGRVLEIGGLKEKSLAALRCGIKMIIIPSDNKKDIQELPQVVRENISFICADNMDKVVKYAFDKFVPVNAEKPFGEKKTSSLPFISPEKERINNYMK
ncbi:MAG: endopeptidase La [Clostridia bacterium]|nr:endopeptidase La [Clostridia bacterium]